MTPSKPPQPGEWHPAYETHRALLAKFLRNDFQDRYVLPRIARPRFGAFDPMDLTTPMVQEHRVFTKRPAYTPCPWTGSPAAYQFMTAFDELGRSIASSIIERVPISEEMDNWRL
jgi:hypothetical protein